MVEHWINDGIFASTEVPLFAIAWFGVNDNRASDGEHRGGVKVERTVVVFPGRHCRGNGVLEKYIKGEFGLGK